SDRSLRVRLHALGRTMILESVITCPHCAIAKSEAMPTDACQFFYTCTGCLKAMTIDAESTLDRRGTQLLEEIEKCRSDLEKVKADLHRFCPISKVVRDSGTELEEVWNVTRP